MTTDSAHIEESGTILKTLCHGAILAPEAYKKLEMVMVLRKGGLKPCHNEDIGAIIELFVGQ